IFMANGIMPSFQERYQIVHVNFLQALSPVAVGCGVTMFRTQEQMKLFIIFQNGLENRRDRTGTQRKISPLCGESFSGET
ncbi:MAG: hypothetical protein ACT6FE_01700, partial [Methanosarcinaceae archaeon]